jgi:hypothetical protein
VYCATSSGAASQPTALAASVLKEHGMLKAATLAAFAVAAAVTSAGADIAAASLVGSYEVTGTEADGQPYPSAGIVDVSLSPSGALELHWDNKSVGVGQVVGNSLAVACSAKGRILIMVMDVNPDGSLSGKWWRRADRGSKGSETWKKK